MDKCESFSACGGPLFAETRSALVRFERKAFCGKLRLRFGRTRRYNGDFEEIYGELLRIADTGEAGEVYRTHRRRRAGGRNNGLQFKKGIGEKSRFAPGHRLCAGCRAEWP